MANRRGAFSRLAGRRQGTGKPATDYYVRLQGMETLERRLVLSTLGPFPRIVQPTAVLGSGDTRVVEGTATDQFRSVGIIGDRFGGFCSGTLVSPVHVATAAHCAVGIESQDGRFSVEGTTYETRSIHVHPRYNDFTLDNDIAIFHLARPVSQVVPSPIFRGVPRVGQLLTLVGYGAGGTGESGHNGDFGTKRVGVTPIDGVEETLITWRFDDATESNTAPGDSGGAAFLTVNSQYYLAGITSGGDRWDAGFGDNSFDTRVDSFADWIDQTSDQATSDPSGQSGEEEEDETSDDSSEDQPGDVPGDQELDDSVTEDPGDDTQDDPLVDDETTDETTDKPEPPVVDQDDHADVAGPEATEILFVDGMGGSQGVLEMAGDRDVFQVVLAESGLAVIGATSVDGRLDTYLRVYDEAGSLIAENDDAGGSFNSQVQMELEAGSYFLDVGAYADWGIGNYEVQVEILAPDSGSVPETELVTLNPEGPTRLSGEIVSPGEIRSYSFVATQSGRMTIRTNRLSRGMDTMLTAYDSQGNELAFNDDWRGLKSRVRISVEAGETYRVDVAGYRDSTGSYRLVMKTRDAVDPWFVPGADNFHFDVTTQDVESTIQDGLDIATEVADTIQGEVSAVAETEVVEGVWTEAEEWAQSTGDWGESLMFDIGHHVDTVLDLDVDWLGWLENTWF